MSNEQVHVDIEDGVARMTLDNPQYRNALSIEMARGINAAIDDIEDSEARCLVIEGANDAFCAGGDIESMLEALSLDSDLEPMIEEVGKPVNKTVQNVYECSIPTIAKVDGPAYGAGGSLAIANDIVVASGRAEISFSFRRVGLSVDSGTSYLLPRMVGENVAKNLVLRDTILEADEAAELGLVQEVFPTDDFDARAEAVVDELAEGPTVALRNTKALLQAGLDRSMEQAIDNEVESLKEIFDTEDFSEGVTAFIERRSPDFVGQ